MRTGNSLSNRLIALALSIVMVLGMVPAGVVSAEGTTNYGVVESLSEGVSISGSGAEVKATFAGTLNWVAADSSAGRNSDGWWIGLKVTAPETIDMEKAMYTSGGQEKFFKDYNDSEDDADVQYITLWGLVKEEYLRSANLTDGLSTYTWTFDWDGNGEFEQTVVLDIDADQTVLLDSDSVQTYPAASLGYGVLEMLTTGATITGNESAAISISYDSEITVDWVEADTSVGRYQDGWWAGMKITIPAGMTVEQVKNAQYMSGSTIKAFWDYKDSQDDAEVHYLTMWVPLNNLLSGSMEPYTYKFDWNNDGIFEQSVVLSVDASKVTLTKDGAQVYPVLGQVSSYNGGSVVGSGTGVVEVVIDDVTLNWSAADDTIGRTQGWWVGIKVEAPAGMGASALENAVYQSKSGPTSDWSADKSFWSNKDSSDSDATHYIGLWFQITPASLAKFAEEGRNITMWYQFDWDDDGSFEQSITFSVDPTGNIVLDAVDQTGFGFETTTPEDIWVGEGTYTNVASGGQSGGTVSYEVIEGSNIATVDANGVVTFTGAGTVTIQATLAADDDGFYNAATAQYTITTYKNDQYPKFTTTQPSAITYAPGLTYPNPVVDVLGGTVKYEIIDEDVNGAGVSSINETTGELSILKAGTVKVQATISGDVNYNPEVITYTLVINKADQPDFAINNAPAELTWQAAPLDALELINGLGDGAVTWTIASGEDVASVDADGKITLLKAGTFTIQAQKAGDDCYNESAAVSATILVNPAEQTGFGFGETEKVTVTYNDNGNKLTVKATGGQSGKTVVYTVISGDAATVDQDGVVTIIKAGTVVIKATKPADDRYKETSDTYELVINPDTQKFTFENGAEINVLYGTTEYSNSVVFDAEYSETSKLTYTLSENEIGATIDAATGKITFSDSETKVGTLTITATKAADDCYIECSASYTLAVSYLTADSKPVASGDKLNDSGWFTGNVVIDAPTGYTISYDNELSTADWSNKVSFSAEGADKVATVYLKNAEGYITDAIKVEDINTDTVNPEDLQITYTKPTWEVVLETVTFGLYQSETLNVTISAKDVNSGIVSLVYNVGDGDVTIPVDGMASASHSFTINAQYRNKITLTVTDTAGRQTKLEDEIVLILDTKNPDITAEYEYASGQHREDGSIIYTQKDTTITFTIDETNFDLSNLEIVDADGERTGAPVVTVNDEEKTVTWSKVEGTTTWQGELTLSGDGDYVVKVTFTDAANNVMDPYEQEIHIDSDPSKIVVDFDNDDAKNENNYDADREATITITEHNFKAQDVELVVTAKNILDKTVEVMDYKAYAKNPANWTTVGDVHTLKLPFTVDAIYTMSVSYRGLAQNPTEGYNTEFVIDHTDADNITITYSTPITEKILEFVTFGIYQPQAVVTVTAEDITAGVDYFELTYTKADGSSSINKESETVTLTANQNKSNAKTFTATYTLPAQADGLFSVVVYDKASNDSSASNSTRIVVDTKNPVIDVEYEYASGAHNEENNIYYTQGDVDITFTINEANFVLADAPVVTVNGTEKDVTWTASATEDEWNGKITLSGDGDYKVKVTFADASTNAMTDYEQEVHIDSAKPVIGVVYDNNTALNNNCYKADRTAAVTITEHNFKAQDVKVVVTAKNILDQTVSVADYSAYASNPANWTSNGDVYTLKTEGMLFCEDAIYTVTVNYTDLAGNAADEYKTEFVIDHTDANNITITYSTPVAQKIIEKLTFGFYKADVVVTVTAEDLTSGVDYFELSYTRDADATSAHTDSFMQTLVATQSATDAKTFTASYTVPAQARGSFSVEVFDKAGNDSSASDTTNVIVTDTISPEIEVSYATKNTDTIVSFRDADVNKVDTVAEAENILYNGNVIATITVNEANFFEGKTSGEKNDEIVHEILIKVTKTDDNGNVTVTEYLCAGAEQLVSGAQTKEIVWTTSGDTHTTSIEFADDGDYVVEVSYIDLSENNAHITGNDGNSGEVKYTSKVFTVDKTAPVIEVTYDNNTALNENCYKADRTATITVTEHNFKAEEFVVTVEAENILGDKVSTMDYAAFAADPANWKHEGNVHTLKLTFSTDAIFKTFEGAYTDLAGNADDFTEEVFVVDHTPTANIQITYSTPVVQKIIETLSFGFYKADMVVTVTAEDITSGVDYFELTYTRDEDATDAHTDDFMETLVATQSSTDGKTFTASYTLSAEARGSFSVKVFDKAGNDSSKGDPSSVIVTDTVSPEIEITYAGKDANTTVHFVDSNIKDVETFAEANNAFYNGNVIATITVNEANFFEGKQSGTNNDEVVHEIIIKVTKTDDDGNVTVTEYLCAGAEQLVAGAQAKNIVWTTTGDTHTTSIEFADDGDYVVEISYADFSANESKLTGNDGVASTKTYTSKIITVDKTAPVINVEYGNTEVINTIENREYYNKVQSAVITVTEHNFRAEDIAAVVTAKNFLDGNVTVADFAAQLADEKNWTHNGNVHTAKVEYTVDANYTFDIDYEDLALNASADYEMDLFTVDTTAPTNLTVSYSTNVFQEILQSITFGYYNATMTVTITAEDATTGILHFAYSYINGEGVSGVNAELLNQAIQSAEIRYENGTAIATFDIPKMVLANDNQFNGTVEFTAYDRSENSTELKDSTRIIVDNISPTATITYNNPVQNVNNISYYDGNIEGTIVITEANFDSSDVVVTITKDGTNYPVNVAWRDNNVDNHTGTFTLTEDGDYIVSVQYKDKSGNQMSNYTSNELTLDTTTPTINVSNIKANSANKDAEYGFVIEINDINLDSSSMKPVLKAVVQNENGVYEIVEIDLGDATTVVNGQTYTYIVENLTDDALYTLSCEVKDMSGNVMTQVALEDGESYDQVQFSINRSGSAFGYGNAFTEELVGQYYIYSVDEDVVIVEVNVDPIENYKITLNGKDLVEGTDYTTVQSSKDGEWSKRTYTISKDLFTEEGEYNIIVTSVDKANTTAYSDVKNLSLAFVVDQTKPVLTITGLETGGRYQTDAQTVTLIPTDEGGRLNELKIVVLDSNGNPLTDENGNDIGVRFEMSGEELLKYLEENDGKVTFTVPEGLNNQVQIICNDCAVNAENLTNEYSELFERVTVSQNQFVIFYANKPLFYGTIAGVLVLIILIIILLKRKKDKKEEKANKAKAKA